MLFQELIGQETAKKQLLQMAHSGRLPHALMISAPEGSGGLPMAFAFAQYLFCENKTDNDACGQCDSCIKTAKLTHPDLHFSFPVIKKEASKVPVSTDFYKEFRQKMTEDPYTNTFDWLNYIEAENKQGNITAEECREIIQRLNLKSFERGYKVLIMWRPEFLGNEGNILLKLIEEPPLKTILIFVCEQYEKVLSTIQSRVQLLQLHQLHVKDIENALLNKGVPASDALKIASQSEGNYNKALQLSTSYQSVYFQWLKDWFNHLYTNNGVGLSQWSLSMADTGRDTQKLFLENAISVFENYIRVLWMPTDHIFLPEDELQFIQKLIKAKISVDKIKQFTQVWTEAIYNIERNCNAKILFHAISIETKNILFQSN